MRKKHLLDSRFGINSIALLLLVLSSVSYSQKDTIPEWLDTIPPIVTVKPDKKTHNEIFHISLEANEVATIHVGVNSRTKMEVYRRPITITGDGTVIIYFQGEDDFGNKSVLDSATYLLDRRPPQLIIKPDPGRYRKVLTLKLISNEPCSFYFHKDKNDTRGKEIPESLTVEKSLKGLISAVDRAGNRTISDPFEYIIDTTQISVSISPEKTLFNTFEEITLKSKPKGQIFYSFDPSAPADWFTKYEKPVKLSYGLNVIRYFARTKEGAESEIYRSKFVVDTVPPTVRFRYSEGTVVDTVTLSTREASTIWYTLDGKIPTQESLKYENPITVKKIGRFFIRARARDAAGNMSNPYDWDYKYDEQPPSVTLSHRSGLYSKTIALDIRTNEASTVFYTLDGSEPSEKSLIYRDKLNISKQGKTTIRVIAVDRAGNKSKETSASYYVDSKAPSVQARIEQNIRDNIYTVTFTTSEKARIFYEIGERTPSRVSPEYKDKITMRSGQTLRYFALDSAGNSSTIRVMEDLKRPIISASPGGGVFNRKLKIGFVTNMKSEISWRLLPDTSFRSYRDSIRINREGTHSLEYYSITPDGMQSPIHRNEFVTDWTSPLVNVTLRRGIGDSLSVFFDCSENATIYYTTDGSSPLFSRSVRMAGNKFLTSQDRISVKREKNLRLSYYAEDIAGNQSGLTVYDLSKPRATPSVPAGIEKNYKRFLSITLNTLDDRSQIYYSHHGNTPTIDSTLYTGPITLLKSDTLVVFVMDASGFMGDLDTFIYLIDLPPSAQFTLSTDTIFARDKVVFDASVTVDQETPVDQLLFRWDFDGDGRFDTRFSNYPKGEFSFKQGGLYQTKLEVKDEAGRLAELDKKINVHEFCPDGMRFVITKEGHNFCIDAYEWPNVKKKTPYNEITWIEAKMHCINSGKRLCTADEWKSACQGSATTTYPYGSQYEEERCPDHGSKIFKSGSFSECNKEYGISDMIGNVWEWVDSKKGDYPMMLGGSYKRGRNAHCRAVSTGTVISRSQDVGFRCCK